MSHVTHMNGNVAHMNESCHTYDSVMSHLRITVVTLEHQFTEQCTATHYA